MTVLLHRLSYCLLFLLVLWPSCRKKDTKANADHPVPSVAVQITIYPNDPLYFKVQAIGGWMYIDGGINGIVLYRKSNEEFVAVERTSSELPKDPKARVVVQQDNFTLRDSISGSEWRMFDGSVTKGPAKWNLRLYGTVFDGNALRIQN
jgi:hypothetical protein